ncbi:hypothetical protein VP01_773g19 [Puccinia sorghi]|uniref:Uncharacterized protein n=1 Tax=Puccinia sorghi TaxID=27349 RepID=A0A0L6UBF4_9BASI|nr:hypothetical protein VP01_773g19 [Puccinia sorghi]
MAKAGITHRDNKFIRTKLQELQHSYLKASGLSKTCKYWDELHPIKAIQTCTNPPVTLESTSNEVPNLFGTQNPTDMEHHVTPGN